MTHPEECRAKAALCIEMAKEADDNVSMESFNILIQSFLYDMAETWLRVADQLELQGATSLDSASQAPRSYH
jgi:hypothetical protein